MSHDVGDHGMSHDVGDHDVGDRGRHDVDDHDRHLLLLLPVGSAQWNILWQSLNILFHYCDIF